MNDGAKFEEALQAIHDNLVDLPFTLVSKKQVMTIVGLMQQGLQDKSRETRIAVLRLLAGPAIRERHGVEIETTKNLTGRIASFLIDQLHDPAYRPYEWRLSPYGEWLISRCEKAVKAPLEDRAG